MSSLVPVDNATKADKVAALQAQKDEIARRYVSSLPKVSRPFRTLTDVLIATIAWPTSKRSHAVSSSIATFLFYTRYRSC